MDGFGWTIQKSDLVKADEAADALTRFQENVLHPVLNSTVIEPYNLVASAANEISAKFNGPKLLEHKADFETQSCRFLSLPWLTQSVAGGLAMLIPYALAGRGAGALLTKAGALLNVGEHTASILENEAWSQILGAAAYDGLRETRPGETHLANSLGGVTAFGTFAIGHILSKDLPLSKMLALRTLAGAIGGTAQHAVAGYLSGSGLPTMHELGRSMVNGMVMSVILPESQRLIGSAFHHGAEHFDVGVPLDRFYEAQTQAQPVHEAKPAQVPTTEEGQAVHSEHLPTLHLEHGAPESYDFFVKVDSSKAVGPEHGTDISGIDRGSQQDEKKRSSGRSQLNFNWSNSATISDGVAEQALKLATPPDSGLFRLLGQSH